MILFCTQLDAGTDVSNRSVPVGGILGGSAAGLLLMLTLATVLLLLICARRTRTSLFTPHQTQDMHDENDVKVKENEAYNTTNHPHDDTENDYNTVTVFTNHNPALSSKVTTSHTPAQPSDTQEVSLSANPAYITTPNIPTSDNQCYLNTSAAQDSDELYATPRGEGPQSAQASKWLNAEDCDYI